MKSCSLRLALGWVLVVLAGCDLAPSHGPSPGSDPGEHVFRDPALVLGTRGLCAGRGPEGAPGPDRITVLCDLLSRGPEELTRLPSEGPGGMIAIESALIDGWAAALDHDERVATILALGMVGGGRALDWLLPGSPPSADPLNEAEELEAWLRVRAWGRILARQHADDPKGLSDEAEVRIPALLRVLGGQGPVVREAAAALATLQAPELWALWAPDVRRELARVVDEIKRSRASNEATARGEARGEARGDARGDARGEANVEAAGLLIDAIGQQRSPEDRAHLLELLTHEAPGVRAAAVRALSGPTHIEASGVRAALWDRLLHDPSDAVGVLAAEGVLRGLRVPQSVLVDAERLMEQASPALAFRAGPLLWAVTTRRGVEPVIRWTERMLADHPEAAALGIDAVGALSDPPLTAVLFSWADHPHPAVEGAATRALHRRWERISAGEEEMVRTVALFNEKIRTGGRMAATYAVRGLGHPVFLPFGGREVLEEALMYRVPDAWHADLAFERDRMLAVLDAFEGRGPGSANADGAFVDGAFVDGAFVDGAFGRGANADGALDASAVASIVDPPRGSSGSESPGSESPGSESQEGGEPGSPSYLILELESGSLVFELFQGACCPAAAMAAAWALEGRFEGVPLHRVIPGFLVQGGDGLAEDGTGGVLASSAPPRGPAYPFQRGTLGLALPSGDSRAGSQFFVSLASTPGLDGAYAAMGQLVSDARVLDSIRVGGRIRRACVARDRPQDGMVLSTCPAPAP